jgi:hypothetical protein
VRYHFDINRGTIMDESTATTIADSLGGETWQSGGDIWRVILRKESGRVVALSDDCICEYETDEAFDQGRAIATIYLR